MKIPLGHKLKIMKKIWEMTPKEEEIKESEPMESYQRPAMAEACTQDEAQD